MKNVIRVVSVLVMVLCLIMGTTAYASSLTQSNVTLELFTDKESYSSGDSVVCTFNVLNSNDQELTITYDVVLPEGLELAAAEKGCIVVGAGEEASGKFALTAVRGADGVPSTGDSFPVELLLAVFAVALVLIAVIGMKKKQLMMFMLVFVMLFGMMQPALVARAEEVDPVTEVEGGFLPEEEKSGSYAEDAFQVAFEDQTAVLSTEEEQETQQDSAELSALARSGEAGFMVAGEVLDQVTLQKTIMLDNQLVTIVVNATIANGGDELNGMKATLAVPNFKSITIQGKTKFKLDWAAVPGATHYEVWHQLNGTYVKKVTTPKLTWTTTYGTAGVINTYKVRAVIVENGVTTAKSAYATRTAYGMDVPSITKVEYVSTANNDVRLTIKAGSFCTGYNVYRSNTGAPGTYVWIGKTTSLSFIDKYHNAYYKVRPYYEGKNGVSYSGPASALNNMPDPFDIITQPQDATVRKGQKATMSIEAIGKGLTYTWYYADKGKTTFSKSKIATNSYSTTMTAALDGRRVYCIVTDANGRKRTTRIATMNALSDFTYTITNGKVCVTGYVGTDVNVVIPATIEDCPVVTIGNNAFKGNTTITSVTIPTGVVRVGEYAFANCTKLASVTIANTVSTIAKGAFMNCTSLTTMTAK